MKMGDKIIVAIDTQDYKYAIDLVTRLSSEIKNFKIGMELYYSQGPEIIEEFNKLGVNIFLDLKVHDIPNTAAGAAESITGLDVWMWNVHVAGGLTMMESAVRASRAKAKDLGTKRPLLIGVTQLTSTNQEMLENQIGIKDSIVNTVISYAKLAKEAGLDGVVASAQEVPFIKEACGSDFITVTPGIRMPDASAHDQIRVTTPRQAVELKTDYMVIGRNITAAADPLKAAKEIIASMEG